MAAAFGSPIGWFCAAAAPHTATARHSYLSVWTRRALGLERSKKSSTQHGYFAGVRRLCRLLGSTKILCGQSAENVSRCETAGRGL